MAKCPHCDGKIGLDNVRRSVKGLFRKEVMYSCPHCRSVLGFTFFFDTWLSGGP